MKIVELTKVYFYEQL